MDLILIACCDRKREGGFLEFQKSSLRDFVAEQKMANLYLYRQTIAERLGLPEGPDFGCSINNSVLLMPAYKRYCGRVYERSDFLRQYPNTKKKKVIIVSTLYGILDANDSIRDYNLMMDDKLRNGKKVKKFWRNNQLGKMLQEYIENLDPGFIHDLLPISYRYALQPYLDNFKTDLGKKYIGYDYPGLGTGSLWKRGDDLKEIFEN